MAILFGGNDPPAEDPKVKAMRELEQRRAEDDRLRETQLSLAQETARRKGYGLQSFLGPLGLANLSTTIGSG